MRAACRPAVAALWELDAALAAVLAASREPMIARIKLAWWREALERLDNAPPPPEPVLAALATHVLPSGITGAELATLEAGWVPLTNPEPLTGDALRHYARDRGGRLFQLSARLLGGDAPERAGVRWALVDLARRSGVKDQAYAMAGATELGQSGTWPPRLRPLGMLDQLAARDCARGMPFEPHGSPRRMLAMLRHRLTGR